MIQIFFKRNIYKFFLYLFTIIALVTKSYEVVIAKSKLETCTNSTKSNTNSTNENEEIDLSCSEKILVSLAIDNNKFAETDSLEAYINEIEVNKFSKNSEENTKKLKNPIRINISKTPVYVEYIATYMQNFNHKPSEKVVLSNVFDCEDGDLAKNPTCGWTMNSSNQIIPFSQGFCCKCEFSEIIGINNTDRNRGNTCKFLNLSSGSATAHCLHFHDLWWSGYEIKQYNIVYEIKVFITYANDNDNEIDENKKNLQNLENNFTKNSNNFTENSVESNTNFEKITKNVLTLSPSKRISASDDKKILARLIGDFLPSSSIPDLDNNLLIIPTHPNNHPMVSQGPANWMLIPKSKFTFDGRECNKIGISYSAFRKQNEKCNSRIGDCLHNQISDFYEEDIERLSAGQASLNLISQAKLLNDAEVNFYAENSSSKKLSFKMNGIFNSLITLEIAADDLRYVVNLSKGKIDFIKIENFENASTQGLLNFQITNTGKLTADFFVFYSCSDFILPINSDKVSLFSNQSHQVKKNLFTAIPENITKNPKEIYRHNCLLMLNDINGNELHKENIFFNTTRIIEKNEQLPVNSTKEEIKENDIEKLENKENVEIDCAMKCQNFFDFFCFIGSGCWGYFFRSIIICVIILAILLGILKSILNGKFFEFFRKIFFCFYQNKSTNNNSNKIDISNNEHLNVGNFKKKNLIHGNKFLNFSNKNFNFSALEINESFSVPIILIAESIHDNNENLLNMSIIEIKYPDNFILFCKNKGIKEIMDVEFVQNKLQISGFLTDEAKYNILSII